MEWVRHRPANDAGRCAHRVLGTHRLLLRQALALALLVPTLVSASGQDLPSEQAARFSEGVTALKAGKLDSAEAAFRAVIKSGGDRAFVRHNLGIVLQQQERHRDAIVQFRAATRLDPAFGPSHLLAGTSLIALREFKAAVVELGLAAKLMPREPAVHLQRADACERLDDVLCLADEYRVLVDLSPDNPEYAYRLGKAYLRLSQWSHGRIRSIDPSAARLSQALGREYLDQGRADLAERAFQQALSRDATLVDVHLALARIYVADGRWDEAARAVARALTLAPESRDAKSLKASVDAARVPRR
jgi:tetratricopeptide (TPR) repeat protein